jgi:hypothetical protein
MNNQLIVKDPEILSGMPVFKGTRVPVKNLQKIRKWLEVLKPQKIGHSNTLIIYLSSLVRS